MYSLNRAMIIGNLTRDPELKYTPSGTQVANFGIATNRRWTGADGAEQNATDFHDVVVWGKLAEVAGQILHKGQPAYVEGRIQTRSWEAPDGSKRYKTEIVAENMIALSKRADFSAPMPSDEFLEGPSASKTEKSETAKEPTKTAPAKAADKAGDSAKADKKEATDEVTIEDLDDIPF